RQVEVLREVLTDVFERKPDLEPRDVLILCPDVEEYAPLFRAVFGGPEGHPGRELPVRIADRNHAATNPLFDLAQSLLSFVGGRIRSTELLEVLQRGEVQRRFRLSDTDVETLAAWIKESGIRWGLDLDHRAQFDLTTAQNTIRAGLDRLLLGVALPEADPLAGVLL